MQIVNDRNTGRSNHAHTLEHILHAADNDVIFKLWRSTVDVHQQLFIANLNKPAGAERLLPAEIKYRADP